MKNVMIDIETLGTRSHAVITAIGAVEFDPQSGELGQKFYRAIDWRITQPGRSVEPSTVWWWLEQSEAARIDLLKGEGSLQDALESLCEFLTPDSIVWGNGPTFDISILNDAFFDKPPWKFWNVRDVRTVVDLAKPFRNLKKDYKRKGTHHNALDDAIFQASYVSDMSQVLRRVKAV